MKVFLIALVMSIISFNDIGVIAFALWLFTGWVCIHYDLRVRYFLYGFYIVGGFWYVAASSWG